MSSSLKLRLGKQCKCILVYTIADKRVGVHCASKTVRSRKCVPYFSALTESLCCVAFAVVWWPFLLQLTSIRQQPTPEGPKPDTDRSSAIQTYTAIPSFLLQFACGILYRSTFANCCQTASKLSSTQSS